MVPFAYCLYSYIKGYNEQKRLEQIGVVVVPEVTIIKGYVGEKLLKARYSVDGKTFYGDSKKCMNENNCLMESRSLRIIVNPNHPEEYKYFEDFINFSLAWITFFWGILFLIFSSVLRRVFKVFIKKKESVS